MKKIISSVILFIAWFIAINSVVAQQNGTVLPSNFQPDTRIDNMGYWQKCAALGLVPVEPMSKVKPAVWTGSKLITHGVMVIDSPDVCITTEPSNSTQSENSVCIDPGNQNRMINSNNSTPQPSTGSVLGADWFETENQGQAWTGSIQGAGTSNSGDPAACINLTGRWFVGFIDNQNGQTVAFSDNLGASWTTSKAGNGTYSNMCDKNHLWVDISPTSQFKGNLYDGWMISNSIYITRSVNNGANWSTAFSISAGTNAGSHNQGVNFKCGPDGEVYAVWAVYDSWPSDEKAIGFAKSLDGGLTWTTAVRALNNIRGIRTTGVTQNMRTNSFPSMAVDLSNGPHRGDIYVTWTNIGVPGVNTGSGCDVYMIKSSDKGVTWSAPLKVNTDNNPTKQHYCSWITCDQANGTVSLVFYDNRNLSASEAETWMAWSMDGGTTFQDMKVSDVSFTPSPIPLMATKYMGDYLGITAYGGYTYPTWTDNRSGHCLTYVSPITLIPPSSKIIYQANILNDTTYGNGNGMMDYSEHELLGLKVKNSGNSAADSVMITLSTDSPYITMLDSTEYYGHLDPGQSRTILDGFAFQVSDSIPDSQFITFMMKSVDKKDSISWSSFQIFSHAPNVTALSYNVLHSSGITDGHLVPGESATVNIITKNTGAYAASNVASHLTSNNPYVTLGTGVVNIGTLQAGEATSVPFPVLVHNQAAVGSGVGLHNIITTQLRTSIKDFIVPIGLIVEDWETGNFNKFAWVPTGDKPWTIDNTVMFEGQYSARSGAITDNQTTGFMINYNVMYDDSISFYRKVSSQPLYDKLKFYIDGNLIGQWSGNLDWKRMVYPILAGPHSLKWSYEKDASGSGGQDAAWVDFIVFPPEYKTTAYAGDNGSVCSGNTFQLLGLAVNYDSLRWTTSGTGLFSNIHILNPLYTPSMQDIMAGSVNLTLHAFGLNGVDTSSTMTLSVVPSPSVSAGGNAAVCAGSAYSPINATAVNYLGLQWTTSGDGSFSNAVILKPTYTPGPQDQNRHTVKLALTGSAASSSCPSAADTMTLTIHSLPVVNLGRDTVVCANKVIAFDATTPNATGYLWLPSNKTTPAIQVD